MWSEFVVLFETTRKCKNDNSKVLRDKFENEEANEIFKKRVGWVYGLTRLDVIFFFCYANVSKTLF
jgi:hypothetical protein